MKSHNTIVLLAVFICNINITRSQSLNKDEDSLYLSFINQIGDTSFNAFTCWLELYPTSSFIPHQREGIEYALTVERKLDSSFSDCSTISKNDSLFHYLSAKDMERIKTLYEEWFILWKKDTSIPKRPLDGTEFKWVNLKEGTWSIETIYW